VSASGPRWSALEDRRSSAVTAQSTALGEPVPAPEVGATAPGGREGRSWLLQWRLPLLSAWFGNPLPYGGHALRQHDHYAWLMVRRAAAGSGHSSGLPPRLQRTVAVLPEFYLTLGESLRTMEPRANSVPDRQGHGRPGAGLTFGELRRTASIIACVR
jgi:hypothetical protein